jgi:nitrate/nitrite transport system ATP-binding protein
MVTHDVDEAVLLSDRIVMLTTPTATTDTAPAKAATIGQILDVDMPRPRDRVALAGNAEYQTNRKAVIDFLYAK